jgi:hypothetical protein
MALAWESRSGTSLIDFSSRPGVPTLKCKCRQNHAKRRRKTNLAANSDSGYIRHIQEYGWNGYAAS